MKTFEAKEILKNGNFEIKDREIKTHCTGCGKHFFVDIGVMAEGIAKRGACACSSCGTLTLIPVRKIPE